MMKSIKIKLVLLYLILVFIVMIISGTLILLQIKWQEEENARAELEQIANLVEENIINNTRDWEEISDNYDEYFNPEAATSVYTQILDQDGYLIAPRDNSNLSFSSTVVVRAMAGTEGFSVDAWSVNVNNDSMTHWIEYARPIFDEDGEVELIIFTRLDPKLQQKLQDIAGTILVAVILALLLTGILGVLFASTLTGPIILLTKKSKELAKGNLKSQIAASSNDEIGELTNSFNYMANELNKTMETMSTEKNKIETLLHNMNDGVLAYDINGTLIHANYSAIDLLSRNIIEEMSFPEIIEQLELDVEKILTLQPGNLIETTTEFGDKYISSVLTAYYNQYLKPDGYVIVLQDVTKHKKLDDMRKEFVANVSHEIRTPLTTVKSYAETLMDGAMDDHDIAYEFLSIIDKEVDRMALLVQDLLELSQFDNKQFGFDFQVIDLVKLVQQSIKQNEVIAHKKEQKIFFDVPLEEYIVYADPSRMNQVLCNIISNSVKYTPENGKIEISMDNSDKYYRIYIKDNGMGIPKEDIRSIFDRFYRVDKARSRAMGGTGLGLAIAKEIMVAHGGKISVKSELGKGTTMILRFSKMNDLDEFF